MLFGGISPKVPGSYSWRVCQVKVRRDVRAFQEIKRPVGGGRVYLDSSTLDHLVTWNEECVELSGLGDETLVMK